jgi:hypothetical protein
MWNFELIYFLIWKLKIENFNLFYKTNDMWILII